MTASRASVSCGVSEAVGSSKITTRWGTLSARANLHQLALCDGKRAYRDARVDRRAEPGQCLGGGGVHRPVVQHQSLPDFPSEMNVLRNGEIGREQDFLMNENDAARFGFRRVYQGALARLRSEHARRLAGDGRRGLS